VRGEGEPRGHPPPMIGWGCDIAMTVLDVIPLVGRSTYYPNRDAQSFFHGIGLQWQRPCRELDRERTDKKWPVLGT
jgi:hypothetical protein